MASTFRRTYRCCPPTSATPAQRPRTGICKPPRSYSRSPPSDSKTATASTDTCPTRTGRRNHDRSPAPAAGLLHRAADDPIRRQPAHRRLLPGHLQTAPELHPPADRQAPRPAEPHRPGRRHDRKLPAIPGDRPRQQHRHPQHANLIGRVLAIQTKRTTTTIVTFLDPAELDALLSAPDQSSWHGRRDHTLLVLAAQTGLRVSELTGLAVGDD